MRKLVYKFNKGGYYALRHLGEVHTTVHHLEDAADFSMFDCPTSIIEDMKLEPGKLMLVRITVEEYVPGDDEKVATSCKNPMCPYGLHKTHAKRYCCIDCTPDDEVVVGDRKDG